MIDYPAVENFKNVEPLIVSARGLEIAKNLECMKTIVSVGPKIMGEKRDLKSIQNAVLSSLIYISGIICADEDGVFCGDSKIMCEFVNKNEVYLARICAYAHEQTLGFVS